MSLLEIKKLIKEKKLTPRLNSDSMMKELIWDDQWIGYDDEETHEMKRKFANNLCFGGTMAWSVDFNSGTGDGDSAPVSTDGRCGAAGGGSQCEGSTFGDCCSSSGYCGGTETHCGSVESAWWDRRRRTAPAARRRTGPSVVCGRRGAVAPLPATAVTPRATAGRVARAAPASRRRPMARARGPSTLRPTSTTARTRPRSASRRAR
jgi:hypothetical protein